MPRNPFDEPNTRVSQDALKYFTDRVDFIEAFQKYLDAPASDPLKVLAFCGVGGIGKTALVGRLSQNLHAAKPPIPHARFDLDTLKSPVQAYREVLVRLRSDLNSHFHIDFPHFDLCLALMLAGEGGAAPNLVQVNPTLNSVYQFALGLSPLPFTGAIAALGGHITKQGAKHIPGFEDWLRRAGGTADVIELRKRAQNDDQTLPDELMRRFALDLKDGLPVRGDRGVRGVLFLDTYERLWAGRAADGSRQSRGLDEWVRTLAAACLHMGVLLVITGRDHLRWESDEPDEWEGWLEHHQMGGLSAPDAQAFLSKCGIGDAPLAPPTLLQQAIIDCTDERARSADDVSCHTLFLALCAEIVLNTRRQTGQDPPAEMFHGIPAGAEARELADRFLQSLHDRSMEMWLEELSLTPRFDKGAALALRELKDRYEAETAWELLTGFSFATSQPDGFWRLHEAMRDALSLRVAENDARRVHALLRDYWVAQGDEPLVFFHRWSLDPFDTLYDWLQKHRALLKDRRISEARLMLISWADIPLNDAARRTMGDEFWAIIHVAIGIALLETPAAPRSAVLTAAIGHFEAALRVYTEADFPQNWAATQNFLGNAYCDLPTGNRSANLERAIACYKNALRVYAEADFPLDWASTQNNLGIAYRRLPIGDRAVNLGWAIAHHESALRVYTEADFSQVSWAMTQNNLGAAHADLPTGDRAVNLGRAIACYEAALRVYTEADFPQQRASLQNNLGAAHENLPTGDRAVNLERAIAYYEAALRVRTETDFPQEWAGTQNNLGAAHADLPTGDRAVNLGRAITHYETALRVFTEADFPQEWAGTQNNLGIVHRGLPTGDRIVNLGRAIAHYEAALRVHTEANFPQEWATTQNNLGLAFSDLPAGDRTVNLGRAITHYETALRVYTEADFPQEWAMVQNNLGAAHENLPAGDRIVNLGQAIAYYEATLRVHTETDFPQGWARTQDNLGFLYCTLFKQTHDVSALIAAQEAFAVAERGFVAVGLADEATQMRSIRTEVEVILKQIEGGQSNP